MPSAYWPSPEVGKFLAQRRPLLVRNAFGDARLPIVHELGGRRVAQEYSRFFIVYPYLLARPVIGVAI